MKLLAIALFPLFPLCLSAQSTAGTEKSKMPDGPGKDTTVRICSVCNSVEVSLSRRESREGWNAIVVNMVERGAKGTDDEFGEVVDYLTEHFPAGTPGGKVNVNSAPASELQTALEITPEQAAAIVQARTTTGKFKTIDDVAKAAGADPAKLAAKKSSIAF